MAPPASSTTSRAVVLLLRVLTFVLLLISLIILTTNTSTIEINNEFIQLRFSDVIAYRYMLAAIVIGIAYSLLQLTFSVSHVVWGNRVVSGDSGLQFDFYGDKIISYVLATGAAAGFGVTKDFKSVLDANGMDFTQFYEKAYASASLLLLAFVGTAILSVISSYALVPKQV